LSRAGGPQARAREKLNRKQLLQVSPQGQSRPLPPLAQARAFLLLSAACECRQRSLLVGTSTIAPSPGSAPLVLALMFHRGSLHDARASHVARAPGFAPESRTESTHSRTSHQGFWFPSRRARSPQSFPSRPEALQCCSTIRPDCASIRRRRAEAPCRGPRRCPAWRLPPTPHHAWRERPKLALSLETSGRPGAKDRSAAVSKHHEPTESSARPRGPLHSYDISVIFHFVTFNAGEGRPRFSCFFYFVVLGAAGLPHSEIAV
jgi:hypothetical protein